MWYPRRRGVFSRVRGFVKAVDGVDFSVRRGETVDDAYFAKLYDSVTALYRLRTALSSL